MLDHFFPTSTCTRFSQHTQSATRQVWGFIALTCDCMGRVCKLLSGNLHVVRRCPGAFPDRSRRELSESRVASPRGGLFRAAESAFAWRWPVSAAQMPILRLFTKEMPHPALVPTSAARGSVGGPASAGVYSSSSEPQPAQLWDLQHYSPTARYTLQHATPPLRSSTLRRLRRLTAGGEEDRL